jgi:hypothetical protein
MSSVNLMLIYCAKIILLRFLGSMEVLNHSILQIGLDYLRAFSDYRFLIYGVLLITNILYMSNGIVRKILHPSKGVTYHLLSKNLKGEIEFLLAFHREECEHWTEFIYTPR